MVRYAARRRLTTRLITLALFTVSLPASGGEVGSAKSLVQESGLQGGLIVRVGGGNPGWTAALRVNERYLVQGLEREEARVSEARAYLERQSSLGPVTVIRWNGSRLPYADNLVNLLVVESPKDLARDEMLRVLAPEGITYLKTEEGFERQAKPRPDDIDEWTHFLHAPDNNAVAEDTRVAPPRYLQWVAGPRWGRSHDHLAGVSAAVSASGRLFYIADEGAIASVKAPARWMLIALDAFSGVPLWRREVEPWENHLRPFRSGPAELPRRLVAVDDRVYVTLGYGKPVTALDAATGEVVRTYEGTDNTHEILLWQGNLYLVISAPLKEKSDATGKVIRRFERWRGGYDEYVTQFLPKHIRVVNAESGKLVWKKDDVEVTNILPLTLIVSEGRVFFENQSHLVALKAQTGEALWKAERPVTRHRYAWSVPTVVVSDGIVISADRAHDKPVETEGKDRNELEWRVSANHILFGGELIAYSAETGKKLWTAPCHEGFNFPVDVFVANGKVWSGELAWGKQPGLTEVYDLHTGEVVATRSPDQKIYTLGFGHHRCYRNKATTKYVIHGRSGVEFLDMNADRVVADHWVRGACQYGILPCNGLVYAPPHSCACYITAKLNGFNALSGTRTTPLTEEPNRLEKGPAHAAAGAAREQEGPPAWPTYRHDATRSGSTEGAVSPEIVRRWETALPGPLTAVTVAEGRLYVAQTEAHTVHALNVDDGAPLWHFTAGGRVDSPPTVHGWRVYFGSADGWMYCLRSRDGALVWRFRVAPESRQIVSYGQLESVWPVHGNVLVYPGPDARPVAYAAAGRSSYVDGGVFLCGVNASTGELVTQQRISHRDPKTGLEPQDVIRGVRMPGAMPDVLSAQDDSLFMRHSRMDLEGNSLPEDVQHLFSSVGFLDDTWWHRTYFQIGTRMDGGYGGWTSEGNRRVSGRILVRRGNRVFGYGRKSYTITGSHPGLQSQHHLFAADTRLIRLAPAKKQKKRRRPQIEVKYYWSEVVPFHVRAMVLAGDTLFVAGPGDVADFASAQPASGVALRAISASDGSTLREYKLRAAPVFDSFAACGGRLYFTTTDGRAVCYEGKPRSF